MSRLEYLLSLINLQSATRPPSIGGTGERWRREDALAELSYALSGEDRIPVICAILRHAPELAGQQERHDVRVRLCDHLLVFAHTLRRPVAPDRLPEMLHRIAVAAVVELVDWEPCRTCHGKGRVSEQRQGVGLIDITCPDCRGARRLPWSDRRRARALHLSLSTAQNRWLDLYDFGVSRLESWASEGVSAIRASLTKPRNGH